MSLPSYERFAARRRAELVAGSRVVETARGPVEYVDIPAADAGGGPTMLSFHGSPGGYDQAGLLPPVPGYRVIGWSRPGFLRTPLSVGVSYPEQADAAAALLDVLGVDEVVAYGMSAGGPIAIEFARRHSARTKALILESAVSRHYAPEISAAARAVFLSRRGTWLSAAAARRWPKSIVTDFLRHESSFDKRTRSEIVMWILDDPDRLAILQGVMGSLTPYEDRAAGLDNDLEQMARLDDSLTSGVTCPTLVVHGACDGVAAPAHAEHAAGTIPGAKLEMVPEGWHLLALSRDGEIGMDAKRAFVRSLERRDAEHAS